MEETVVDKHVIIHGHFYQPPRENPWTERIDRQESAAPYHDWNERIAVECYRPNSCSRRLDGFGRITKLVNNYEYMSFNFGPTLFSWIEDHDPGLYEKILEADRLSSERLDGHGNAIAQAFNHLIMPLASRRDQETQIKWGLYDFERRFGREPEGIWLPETAINGTTLEILIDFGFRFIILSPHQAERVRPLSGGARWKDVSSGSVPTGFAYRCFGPKKKGRRSRKRFIDIFFYDAPLSQDISFNHLLINGDGFADAVEAGYPRGGSDLVVIATDGEIYGHHEPFADMALSYFGDHAVPARGLHLTNFGAYLDRHEPIHEVQLKSGPNEEGTAWSCSHGVGRWRENCGCNTGGPPGYTQEWRSPLRRGLDRLRDGLTDLFDSEGGRLLKKPWDARNQYIGVVEHRTTDEMQELINRYSTRELTSAERARALSLLESQRNAMLMFTSCGWFFNDISGIETVQLLKYAARAIELAGPGHSEKFEKELLGILKEAKSNTSEYVTGADLYQNARKRAAIDIRFLAGQHAITSFLFGENSAQKIFNYCFSIMDQTSNELGSAQIHLRLVEILSPYTLETSLCCYLLVAEKNADITVYLSLTDTCNDWQSTLDRFAPLIQNGKKKEIIELAQATFDEHPFTLRNLFPEDRERTLNFIAARQIEDLEGRFRELFDQNKNLLRLMREAAIEPPKCFLMPAQTLLSNDLVRQLGSWERSLDITGLDGIKSVVLEANMYGVPIDRTEAAEIFSNLFLEKVRQFKAGLDAGLAGSLLDFVKLSVDLGITINEHETQNELYTILQTEVEAAITRLEESTDPDPDGTRTAVEGFLRLAQRFNFNTESWQERLK